MARKYVEIALKRIIKQLLTFWWLDDWNAAGLGKENLPFPQRFNPSLSRASGVQGASCSVSCSLRSFHRHWRNFFISRLSGLHHMMHENESFLTSLPVRVWHLQVYQSFSTWFQWKNGINNQLEMEAPSSGVCRCCERNKLTFAADGTSAVVKNNWKLMCSWLLGSVPDRKEKVWIKDDCSLFAPSQAPVTWWKDRWFSLGLWVRCDDMGCTDCCFSQDGQWHLARFNCKHVFCVSDCFLVYGLVALSIFYLKHYLGGF